MEINHHKKNETTTFGQLQPGEMFRAPESGGLAVKLERGAAIIQPLDHASIPGAIYEWPAYKVVIPVKSITVYT